MLEQMIPVEEGSNVTVCLLLSGNIDRNVSASVSTVAGTATGIMIDSRRRLDSVDHKCYCNNLWIKISTLILFMEFSPLGSSDYEELTNRVLTLSPSQNTSCVTITVEPDLVIENTEMFLIMLANRNDDAVRITADMTAVMISDETIGLCTRIR